MSEDQGKTIRIRMASGKIYGPYSREDILKFIRIKKLSGEEEMLVMEEGRWKPVSSDPEFFDQIQVVISGAPSSSTKSARSSPDQDTKVTRVDELLDPEEVKTTVTQDGTRTFMPFEQDLQQLEKTHAVSSDPSRSWDEEEKTQARRVSPGKKSKKQEPQSRRLLLWGALALVFVGLFLSKGPRKNQDAPSSSVEKLVVDTDLQYFSAIERYAALYPVNLKLFPLEVVATPGWSLPAGFGFHVWIQDLSSMEKEEALFGNSTFWMRRAWNALWMAQALSVVDRSVARRLETYGQEIVETLTDKNLLDSQQQALLSVIPAFASGKWSEARKILEPLSQDTYVAWLLDEISFVEFIDRGRNNPSTLVAKEFRNPFLDIQSQLRKEMLQGGSNIESFLEQLSEFDGQSFVGLLSAAEFFWRAHASGIPRAQQAFLSLLSVTSLFPMSYQAIAWREYAEFQGVFGRGAPQEKALENFKLVLGLDAGTKKSFWDLGSEDLSVSNVTDQLIRKIERKASSLLDIAFLESLSFGLRDPAESLLHVIHYAIFYKDWDRAVRNANFILERAPGNVDALGAKLWVEATNYRFDEAYDLLDKISTSEQKKGDAIKYEGAILGFGRDYDAAISTLERYQKLVPNDGMGHYFLARTFFETGKNHECVKSANLGRIHGRGALRFLSELLYYRCRILAKLPMSEALKELERATRADPQNIFIAKEYVFALHEAGKEEEALELAKDYVRRLPHAYQLKILLGSLYEKAGKWDEALLFYNDAKKVRPNATEASVNIADMFLAKERYEEAAQNYLSAARNDPFYPDLYLRAAQAYRKGGNRFKALEYYKKELELRPSVLRTFLEAAEFMLEINLPQQVPELFQKYEDNFRGDPRVMLRLAQAYAAMQDIDNAEKTAKLALAQDPKLAEAYRILGRIYDSTGQYGLAKDNFEKYLHLLPQAADADAVRARLSQPPYY